MPIPFVVGTQKLVDIKCFVKVIFVQIGDLITVT
jgi:hypothetical protein